MSMGCARPVDIASLQPGQEADLFNGRDLTGWKVLTEDYFDMPGKVRVEDGAMVLGAGSDLTGVQWTGHMVKDDYALLLKAKRVDGSDFFCGLTFPVREGYVTLILGGWGGTAVGLSNVDDLSAVENQTTQMIEFKQNRWYEIDVCVAQGYVRVYLDRKKIIEQVIEGKRFNVWLQMEPVRPLGIATYGTIGAIKHVKIERLDGAPGAGDR